MYDCSPTPAAGVPRESVAGERRVALTPAGAAALLKAGFLSVVVERGAGEAASFGDDAYVEAGALLGSREQALGADVVLKIREPGGCWGLGAGGLIVVQAGRWGAGSVSAMHVLPRGAADRGWAAGHASCGAAAAAR